MNITSVTKYLWALTKHLCSTLLSLQVPPLSEKIVKEMVWDPKVGFKIPYGPYTVYNMLTCNTVISGQNIMSVYIPNRQSESFVFFFLPSLLIEIKK